MKSRRPTRRASRSLHSRLEDDLRVTAPLYAIGRFCSRHHYPTTAAWLIVAAALVVAGQSQASRTNDNLTLPGLERLVPHGSIENEDFFAKRDAAAQPARGE